MSLTPHPPYVAIDLETTGLDRDRDAIIEVAAIKFNGDDVVAEFHTLVKPKLDIPLRVRQITGLTPDDLADAPSIDEIIAPLVEFVGQSTLVGHSIEFDLAFLNRNGANLDQLSWDTFELATMLVPEAKRYTLGALVELLGLEIGATHRALDDAHAHRVLFTALLERARRLPPYTLAAINVMASRVDWSPAAFFRLAARDPLPAFGPDQPAVEPTRAPLKPAQSPKTLDADALEAIIAPGGALSLASSSFEDRPAQRAMLRRVVEALDPGDHLLVEAGTGTGKSLAYLLPAAAWATANGRPVVVATHTITLQDQLLHKELPTAARLLGVNLVYAVLKGRSNYLCRTRLETLVDRDDLQVDDVRAAAKLLVWMPRTKTGDRAELLLQPAEDRAWRLASAEGESCTPKRCRHAAEGQCFVQRARHRAEAAHIIVVNHALLVSDLLTDNRLLPQHKHLIVDEAHHLEAVATATLGFDASVSRVRDALTLVASGGRGGLTTRVADAAAASGLPEDVADALREATAAAREPALAADEAALSLFQELRAYFSAADGADRELRLTDTLRNCAEWQHIEELWERLKDPLERLRSRGAKVHQALVAIEADLSDDGDRTVADLGSSLRELTELSAELERIIATPDREDVCWLARGRDGAVALHRAPLHVGDILGRHLFGDKLGLILTSATLRAPDFEFVRDSCGVPDAEALAIDSPFDYSRQCLLLMPTDMPEPNQPGYQHSLATAVMNLARAAQGRTLVLFTSHGGLRATYHAIRAQMADAGIAVVGQGLDGSRMALLDTLRTPDGPTVLLGTRSFWEGVDVPGDALSCLIIARLPFDVPSDPVFAARSENYDEPFLEYAVPQAILRFRQGFGRLVRSRTDRGVVAILDSRVSRRRYGGAFIEALPACGRHDGPVDTLGAAARSFLAGERDFAAFPALMHNRDRS